MSTFAITMPCPVSPLSAQTRGAPIRSMFHSLPSAPARAAPAAGAGSVIGVSGTIAFTSGRAAISPRSRASPVTLTVSAIQNGSKAAPRLPSSSRSPAWCARAPSWAARMTARTRDALVVACRAGPKSVRSRISTQKVSAAVDPEAGTAGASAVRMITTMIQRLVVNTCGDAIDAPLSLQELATISVRFQHVTNAEIAVNTQVGTGHRGPSPQMAKIRQDYRRRIVSISFMSLSWMPDR